MFDFPNIANLPNWEIRFFDFECKREWRVFGSAVWNADVGFVKDIVRSFSPEFRNFVLEAARLIIEAGEGER